MDLQELVANSPGRLRDFIINIYGYKISRQRFNPQFWRYYTNLLDNLTLDKSVIDELYFSSLKNSLIFAKNSKYYENLFRNSKFVPEEMNRFSDIQALPVLDKDTIRKNFNDIFIKSIKEKKPTIYHSSGTTGPKFSFYTTRDLLFVKHAAFIYRQYSRLGIKPFDKRVTIGGRLFTNRKPYWSYNRFENQLLLSAHHINNTTIPAYVTKIEEFDPVFIQGHPSAILALANYLHENNILLKSNPKAIFTTGESLFESDRKTIESSFKTKVYQQYGSREGVISAFEQPNQVGYTLDIERGYAELIEDNSTGKLEIVGTSFLNPVFPFVRYAMGDFAQVSSSSVSNSSSIPVLFESIEGRVDDYVTDSNGTLVLPVAIRMALGHVFKAAEAFQLIQEDKNLYKVNLVGEIEDNRKNAIKQILRKILGDSALITILDVDALINDGGKVRNIVNHMK